MRGLPYGRIRPEGVRQREGIRYRVIEVCRQRGAGDSECYRFPGYSIDSGGAPAGVKTQNPARLPPVSDVTRESTTAGEKRAPPNEISWGIREWCGIIQRTEGDMALHAGRYSRERGKDLLQNVNFSPRIQDAVKGGSFEVSGI